MKTEKEIIPFHEAKLELHDKVTLKNGVISDLSGERSVEVWEVAGGSVDGAVCVRIFGPTQDGKISKLIFGLNPDAAITLAGLLLEHYKPTNGK